MTSGFSDYHKDYSPDGSYSPFQVERSDAISILKSSIEYSIEFFNAILPWWWRGGGADSAPLMFFFHHPETPQAMKLKLSDLNDTSLRHILQAIRVRQILRCYHGNSITRGTLQNLTQ